MPLVSVFTLKTNSRNFQEFHWKVLKKANLLQICPWLHACDREAIAAYTPIYAGGPNWGIPQIVEPTNSTAANSFFGNSSFCKILTCFKTCNLRKCLYSKASNLRKNWKIIQLFDKSFIMRHFRKKNLLQ